MTLSPDVTIADRYALTERIAVGGMGEVWRARDLLLDRTVAVKVLRDSYAADPQFRERFRAEARHMAALANPGIANVYDYGEVGDMAYLVMECVDGEPLSELLARSGRLPATTALEVIGQAAFALQAAHDAGVVHRDVKPGNLLIRPDGVVKVTDFGIARAVDAATLTRAGFVVGTAAYLSPEQAGGKPATPASDVYALGVVAYECLAGQRPFDADSPVALALAHVGTDVPALPDDVPAPAAELVLRCLDKDPAKRPTSAGELGRAALALATAETQTTDVPKTQTAVLPAAEMPASTPKPIDERYQRRIRRTFVAVGAAVVVLGFVILHSCAGGAQQVTMPRVVDQQYAAAAAALHHVGLNATKHEVHDASHPAGVVLAQGIAPGTRVGEGSTVALTVASGPRTETVDAASIVGQPVDAATATLRAENLYVTVITTPAKVPPGTVLAVTPSGSVKENTTVTLTVAAPEPHHGHGKNSGGDGGNG